MRFRSLAVSLAAISLSGCAGLIPPSAESVAGLPIVSFPDAPPAGDFVYRLPARTPISAHVVIEGTALASGADQTLTVTLPRDLYLRKRWVSDDGKTWKPLDEALAIQVRLSLPSDEYPKPGELRLSIDRKDAR